MMTFQRPIKTTTSNFHYFMHLLILKTGIYLHEIKNSRKYSQNNKKGINSKQKTTVTVACNFRSFLQKSMVKRKKKP